MQEMQVNSLRWEDPLETGMATYSNILAWDIPWTEEPGGLQSMGLQNSQTQRSHSTTTPSSRLLAFVSLHVSYSKPNVATKKVVEGVFTITLNSRLHTAHFCSPSLWELDYKESWEPKNWCFWTVVLKKTLKTPLDCKEIKSFNPKGNQSWIFIGRTDAEAPIVWPPDAKNWLTGKDPDAGKDWRQEKGTTEDETVEWHHWLYGHESEQALGGGDGQGSLACCSPQGHNKSDTTEWLNWTELSLSPVCNYLSVMLAAVSLPICYEASFIIYRYYNVNITFLLTWSENSFCPTGHRVP